MKTRDIDEITYNEIIRRIHSVTSTRTQVELAEFLGVRQSSISDAKKRRSIPAEWLLKLFWEKKINPSWVMTNRGAVYIGRAFEEASNSFDTAHEMGTFSSQELLNELVRRAQGTFHDGAF